MGWRIVSFKEDNLKWEHPVCNIFICISLLLFLFCNFGEVVADLEHSTVRSMLNHNVDERPFARDILATECVASLKRGEGEVMAMIQRTLSNPQSKDYKYLIASCINQVCWFLDCQHFLLTWFWAITIGYDQIYLLYWTKSFREVYSCSIQRIPKWSSWPTFYPPVRMFKFQYNSYALLTQNLIDWFFVCFKDV